jgi:hypothetical protein
MRTEIDFELNGISEFVIYWVYKEVSAVSTSEIVTSSAPIIVTYYRIEFETHSHTS